MWEVVCKVIGREMLLCCPVQRDKRDVNSISHSACGIDTNSRIWFVLVLAVKPQLPTNHTCESILECKYSGDSTKCTYGALRTLEVYGHSRRERFIFSTNLQR